MRPSGEEGAPEWSLALRRGLASRLGLRELPPPPSAWVRAAVGPCVSSHPGPLLPQTKLGGYVAKPGPSLFLSFSLGGDAECPADPWDPRAEREPVSGASVPLALVRKTQTKA